MPTSYFCKQTRTGVIKGYLPPRCFSSASLAELFRREGPEEPVQQVTGRVTDFPVKRRYKHRIGMIRQRMLLHLINFIRRSHSMQATTLATTFFGGFLVFFLAESVAGES
jgi:hypothetical protein